MTTIKQDRALGIVLIVAGCLLFWQTFSFRTVSWDPLGLAFWPRIVLAILVGYGLYLTVRGNLDDGPFCAVQGRAFLIALGLGAYVVALPYLGFVVATPLYIGLFHFALSDRTWRHGVEAGLIALVGTALIYWIFQDLMEVQFPRGVLAGAR
jgi:hypothetical protein